MKKIPTIFLQSVVVFIGIGSFAFLLWEPHLEGRNVNATLSQIYFNDPFLVYAYIASIPFFTVIYQTFMLLGHIGQNKILSSDSVSALRTIKYCAVSLVGFVVVPEAYLLIVRPGDDIAGGVAMGLFIIFVSSVVAATAAVLERLLQRALDIKSGS